MTDSPLRKKLIEVSLPLEVINEASIRDKSLRHGHPSTLHPWWSRKPLAACRAILFASLVDDPSENDKFPTEEAQEKERQRLFRIMEDLIRWEHSQDKEVLDRALKEIPASQKESLPPVRDPFCGGGSIPLEAQRLGLRARASDLNPVAVLITKALIDFPPRFARCPSVAPQVQQGRIDQRQGERGLAHDIRHYGKWMREEAEKRIGHLYPKMTLPGEYGGGQTSIIAWLWTRTVTCPNPACGAQMPLTSKWGISNKKGRGAWIEPVVDFHQRPPTVRFLVRQSQQRGPQEGTVNRQGAKCIVCNTPVPFTYIRSEGKAGGIDAQLIAMVAEGPQGRIYLATDECQVMRAAEANPEDYPVANLPDNPRNFNTSNYGLRTFADLFTPRQLTALTTFSDLVREARQRILHDAQRASFPDDHRPLHAGGTGRIAYADAVATYLAIAVDRLADRNSSICSWDITRDSMRNTFARQAIPMIWDFAEANPFSTSTGNFMGAISWIAEVVEGLPCDQQGESSLGTNLDEEQIIPGEVYQRDATVTINGIKSALIVTDPPYYDNISYAELSDFFYIWLRRSLYDIYPDLFQTVLTPKEVELVADPYRFGGSKERARKFFEEHLSDIFEKMYRLQSKDHPLILYYAFKQTDMESEDVGDGYTTQLIASTGWETMLESLIRAGFTITGTWPIRTELVNRSGGLGMNALASSIVLVCRPRQPDAEIASRRQFLNALRSELPPALKKLRHGNIAPVDLAQACIGPGMAIYSRYSRVVEANGTPLRVRAALQLINRMLDEILSEQDGEYDMETRWAIAWFEQYALEPGDFGAAELLSKAKNTSIQVLKKTGWLESGMGKVRLLRREELPEFERSGWTGPMTVWEVMQCMIYTLHEKGEKYAAVILRNAGAQGEMVRDLAYRLHAICEHKKWTQEALAYNGLVTSWSRISQLAQSDIADQLNF